LIIPHLFFDAFSAFSFNVSFVGCDLAF